jgi:isoquinoline 1-oxidoreductase beta subunit
MSGGGATGLSRRGVLRGSAALGLALVVPLGRASGAKAAALTANAFLSVTAEGAALALPKTEMGQGVFTTLAMLVAEELGLAPAQVAVTIPEGDSARFAPIDQGTGGSSSVRELYKPLRQAAANARAALVGAAARQWGIPPERCDLVGGVVIETKGGRRLPVGDLLAAASAAPLPKDAPLRPGGALRVIGKPTRRLDSLAKVTGETVYGIDVRLPGMKVAMLAQCPMFGGTLAAFDEKAARATPGVVQLVKGSDVLFVVAETYWAAMQGYIAANPQWSAPKAPADHAHILAGLDEALAKPGFEAKSTGDLGAARARAVRPFSATYRQPFLAHAPMEPGSCTAHVTPEGCTIWAGSQVPAQARDDAAKALGLPADKVTFHNCQMGGGFGRRLETDMVVRAVELARQVPYPVKLMWSREEDMKHDMYRPAYADQITAALDAGGKPIGWEHRIAGSSIMARLLGQGFTGVDADAIEGAVAIPYALDAHRVTFQQAESAVPTSWWRGVGGLRSAFVVESFIDELAHAAGQDPLAYRLSLVTDARIRAVLERAGREAGWGKPLPAGLGRGIAVLQLWGTVIALVLEARVADGAITVPRATVAVDCGLAINPLGVAAQVESGVIFGLSAALHGEVTIKGGRVEQSNYHDYRILRLNEAPAITTHIVESAADPGGMGEPPCAVVAPALANAVFAASGKRLRTLPLAMALERAS